MLGAQQGIVCLQVSLKLNTGAVSVLNLFIHEGVEKTKLPGVN